MKELFLIIGAPGSGKTTDATIISENNASIAHYSTGDLLRTEVASKSKLGKEIESYISKGNLVPLAIVVNTIVNAIRTCEEDYILIDGYPRSVEQMTELDKVLEEYKNEIQLRSVIEVEVSEEVAKERVLGRNRGDDDSVEVFNNRMKVYLEPIQEIREFYKEKNVYNVINGERSIEEIVNDMNELIINIIKKEI